MPEIQVVKRDGTKEALDLSKFHKVAEYACEGLTGVSASELELKTHIQFYNNMSTSDIQETLIKAAADLISEDTPNYQYVAGRLINYHLRKEVYSNINPPHIFEHYNLMTTSNKYSGDLIDAYSTEEWDAINNWIDHDRDFDIVYAGMEQFRSKYLVKNRVTGEIFETPNMAMMCIAMTIFANYPTDIRMNWVRDFYNGLSEFDFSLPTPIMAGVRTPVKQYSSCVVMETGDSLDSISATSSAIIRYVSRRAGIGIGGGSIRGVGSNVRDGDTVHTGIIPFWKHFQTAVKSCSQGGVRGGAATISAPFWHWEIEDILVLKNNKGTEFNRIRQMDYTIQFSKIAYERLRDGGNITLFSPSEVPGLYDAFYRDDDLFRELYTKAERNTRLRKKTITASEFFRSFMSERKDTGRIYLQNVDHANDHGSFHRLTAPIRTSNLCVDGETLVDVQLFDGSEEKVKVKNLDITIHKAIYCRNNFGKDEYNNIVRAWKSGTNKKVMKITDDESGKYIICTPDHCIQTNRGWIKAQDLCPTDTLLVK